MNDRRGIWRRGIRRRLREDGAGEGVISAAIVVLIMAVIGAGLYVAFNRTVSDAAERIEHEVQQIGG